MRLAETHARLVEHGDDRAIVRCQDITQDFLDDLSSERLASAAIRSGEHARVASVPTQVVDVWLAQGVPFWELSAREIVQRLEREGLSAFITTSKAV